MWTKSWRQYTWEQLNRPWDIIVIGGGITGAGILREAARAGLRVLLLEGRDFASGTSSRSSKLVHGGLRYLKNGQILTTLHSVRERERLLEEGKGLVNPLGFLFAHYKDDGVPRWMMGLGLAVYDTLGMNWGQRYSRTDSILRRFPIVSPHQLRGGFRYFDAQTDDARLVLRVIREGVRDGGLALNYARVENLLRQQDGRVCGVVVRDVAPNAAALPLELPAKVVVNATGAETDILRDNLGQALKMRPLRGSHLVLSAARLPVNRAVSFNHPVDHRPIMAIPWEGVTLFGTTDVDHHQPLTAEPTITPDEVGYLLEALQFGFPSLEITAADVQATFSGVRPVVNTGQADPSKESREHVVWWENGLLTVTGGKLTTFRVMALDALKTIHHHLPNMPVFRKGRVLDEVVTPTCADLNLPLPTCVRLIGRYGGDAAALLNISPPEEWQPIAHTPTLWAELRWAAYAEGVIHLDDLLLRRTRLGLILPHGGLPLMEQIRPIVQPELGWDDVRWQQEVESYTARWHTAYSLPDGDRVARQQES